MSITKLITFCPSHLIADGRINLSDCYVPGAVVQPGLVQGLHGELGRKNSAYCVRVSECQGIQLVPVTLEIEVARPAPAMANSFDECFLNLRHCSSAMRDALAKIIQKNFELSGRTLPSNINWHYLPQFFHLLEPDLVGFITSELCKDVKVLVYPGRGLDHSTLLSLGIVRQQDICKAHAGSRKEQFQVLLDC